MRDSERYRENAADCLLAAENAHERHSQRLNLLVAQSWLVLANHDDAMDVLLAKWEAEQPMTSNKVVIPFPVGNPKPLRREAA